jgi:hypothetical protein
MCPESPGPPTPAQLECVRTLNDWRAAVDRMREAIHSAYDKLEAARADLKRIKSLTPDERGFVPGPAARPPSAGERGPA